MTVLAKSEILKLIKTGKIKIKPFDKGQVGPGSIDLHLGNSFRIFKKANGVFHVKDDVDHKKITELIHVKNIIEHVKPDIFDCSFTSSECMTTYGSFPYHPKKSTFHRALFYTPELHPHQLVYSCKNFSIK